MLLVLLTTVTEPDTAAVAVRLATFWSMCIKTTGAQAFDFDDDGVVIVENEIRRLIV